MGQLVICHVPKRSHGSYSTRAIKQKRLLRAYVRQMLAVVLLTGTSATAAAQTPPQAGAPAPAPAAPPAAGAPAPTPPPAATDPEAPAAAPEAPPPQQPNLNIVAEPEPAPPPEELTPAAEIASDDSAASKDDPEAIVVTGSRIKDS